MKILLFGKNGQLGWELQRSLAPLGEITAVGTSGLGDLAGDFMRPEAVAATVRALQPDLIVNAAAYTAVDKAEGEAPAARLVNATTPGAIAAAASHCGALFVHYSSDYVFDGSGDRPWVETDAVGPLNVYGATKLEGEQLVARHCPRHLILRTSWVYGARGGNFARTMVRLASERDRLTVIADQVGAPTGADLLADVTAHAVRSVLREPGLAGIYHAAAAGETSWHGYARFVLQVAAESGVALKAGPQQIEAIPSSSYKTAARRPHNSRLDTRKLREAFDLALPHWQPGVARMLAETLRTGEDTKK